MIMGAVKKGMIVFLSLVLILSITGLIFSKSVVNVLSGDELTNKLVDQAVAEEEKKQNFTSVDDSTFMMSVNYSCAQKSSVEIPGIMNGNKPMTVECSKIIGKTYSETKEICLAEILDDMKNSTYDCKSFFECFSKYDGQYMISSQAKEDINREFVSPTNTTFWTFIIIFIIVIAIELFLFENYSNFFIINGIIGFLSSLIFFIPIDFTKYIKESDFKDMAVESCVYTLSVMRHNALYILLGSVVFLIVGIVLAIRKFSSSKNNNRLSSRKVKRDN